MVDTAIRKIEMLRHIPREPRKISTSELRARLAAAGFEVTQRTIQRNLQDLSAHFPLVSDERNTPYGWSWSKDSAAEPLQSMDAATALTFTMAEEYLKEMLPIGVLSLMDPHFRHAHHVLESNGNGLFAWRDKIRLLPRSQPLQPPEIDPDIARVVYDSLLHDRRFAATYKPRDSEPRQYILSPQGLAFRDAVTYLVANHRDYDDVVMFALHRFLEAEETDQPKRELADFNIDDWVGRGGFDAGQHEKTIRLVARFSSGAGKHLFETPVEGQRSLTVCDDARLELTADVRDTHQLRWWLRGFGPDVEIKSPKPLRDWAIEGIQRQLATYET
ncbi:WYL domain-containing protein [Guyparkeria hydrothermalis]|uniref:helix-turn-helix transcriptional regulator n=1 Tax=Guyparkeria hydrothermalis TaxID=923 RepID=UPI002020BFB9|nr:WYL domain-containing protein [Guyparkeria hydrothermalis]MCL7744267.1 WYL domain-containing protein [Guyparkeria hydrothermalis]